MSSRETMARARAKRKPREAKPTRSRRAGMPPPVKFDFDALPESTYLTSDEVAGVLRVSIATPPAWRQNKDHPLQWDYVNDKPLYKVGNLRAYIALTSRRDRADDG